MPRQWFLRTQPQVGREHLVGLSRNGLANAVREKADCRQCGDGQAHGGQQHEYFAGAQLAGKTA